MQEAENASALSLAIEKNGISKSFIEGQKTQMLRKGGLLEVHEPAPLSQLGGLDVLKEYLQNRKRGLSDPSMPALRGILLVGLPGGGKSLAAKVCASVFDTILVRLDVGVLMGGIVGQSENNMRQALQVIDAVSPCVVWMDEIEKGFGGVASSNRTDGGTTSRMFGQLLHWMQESKHRKYIVATCNDVIELFTISQGALVRRFDDVFFVDVPNTIERREIIAIMNGRYGTTFDVKVWAGKCEGWTGAEIEKFVIASIYDGEDSALDAVHPIYQQNREIIDKLRDWAKANARCANKADTHEGAPEWVRDEVERMVRA